MSDMIHRFMDEISKLSGLPADEILSGFRVVMLSNNAVYIEGINKIITLSKECVVFKLKKGCIKINGDNLVIKDLNIGSVMVVGKILGVEVL